MNAERIKEIQGKTAYPDSVSVQQALLQVLNECQQDFKQTLAELERVKKELKWSDKLKTDYFNGLYKVTDKLSQAEKELEELKKGQGKQLVCDECKSENIRDTDYGKQCSECFKYI